MNCTKKILISCCALFFTISSKILATEEIEAKIINQINEEKQTVLYSSVATDFSNFEREDYLYENRLAVGTSAKDILKYDLRDKMDIKITDQEQTQLCWIYSTNTVLETNMKLNNINLNKEFDVMVADEETAEIFNKSSSAGLGNNYEGGTQLLLLNYYISGKGPKNIENQTDVEIEDYVIFPTIYKERINDEIKYYNMNLMSGDKIQYTEEQVTQIRNNIKEHILKYGAVTANVYSNGMNYYDNTENLLEAEAFYCDDATKQEDHAITIIGWDDTYSKENFNSEHKPVHDGAYIVLNSWGEDFSHDGVYYISYDDCLIERLILGIERSRKN